MSKNIFLLCLLLLSSFIMGCMSVNLTASGYDKTASMTGTEKKYTILKHFSREMKSWYALFNLIPLSKPNIAEVLQDETASSHGDAVINIKIQGQTTLMDAAVPVALGVFGSVVSPQRGALTAVLIGVRTYTIEGDVIKYLE